MLKIDGPEITMEGPFNMLIKDAARLIHTISRTGSEKFKDDSDPDSLDQGYNEIVEMVLDELATLKKFDSGGLSKLPDDAQKDFNEQLRKERAKEPKMPGFIDYDTTRPDKNKARDLITGIIKDTYNDKKNRDK